jgi:uncharacterized membrane protein YuzA (DUF378 family)
MGGVVKKIYAAAIFLLIVGGMAWGYMGMRGKNPVSQAFGKYAWIVYGLVGLSAVVVLATGRDAYLPFLGPTVFPCAALEDKVPDQADTEVEIYTRPGSKVLYWGSEPASEHLKGMKSWREAYGAYENSGVATADETGKAILRLRKPQPYKVPMKGRLESHVHYRICMADGWMSQVETHALVSEPFVDIPLLEAFQNAPLPPVPEAPIRPVTQTPELPVIADPVSGLPTAVPAAVVPSVVPEKKEKVAGAETPTPVGTLEGFSNEPLYSASEGTQDRLGGVEAEDPRLLRLRSSVEADALKVEDAMGFGGWSVGNTEGVELDAAFQPSLRPAGAPTRAWDARLQ